VNQVVLPTDTMGETNTSTLSAGLSASRDQACSQQRALTIEPAAGPSVIRNLDLKHHKKPAHNPANSPPVFYALRRGHPGYPHVVAINSTSQKKAEAFVAQSAGPGKPYPSCTHTAFDFTANATSTTCQVNLGVTSCFPIQGTSVHLWVPSLQHRSR